MKPGEKKYIIEHAGKESVREMAESLGIKERKVRKFLKQHRKKEKSHPARPETGEAVEKKKLFIYVAIIAVLGFLVYANSFNGEFLWDDINLVRDNLFIKSWSHLPRLFLDHVGAGANRGEYHACRPLQMLSYTVNYSLSGLDVRAYHLTNVILHISVALSLFWLANLLFKNKILSLAAAVLFVVHPVHTGAVSYISGRADSLAALFMLLSFIFYVRHRDSDTRGIYILAPLFYLCALLSRESSLMLPVLLLLYHYVPLGKDEKKRLEAKYLISILSITILYIVYRITAVKHLLPHSGVSTTLIQRLPNFFAALTYYVKLLILPFDLHMEYGHAKFSFANPAAIIGVVIFFSSLVYALRKKESHALISFSVLWFFIALLPQSNLYPINAYMAEHWLYVPSIGIFLIAGWGLCRLYEREGFRIVAFVLFAALTAFYANLTIKQNDYWKNGVNFYERTIKYSKKSARSYNNLAVIYRSMGKREEAIALLKKAVEIKPNYAEAYNSLGILHNDIGEREDAVSYYKKAIELNPRHAGAYSNLGTVYFKTGRGKEAEKMYKEALRINPLFAGAHYNIGNYYKSEDMNEEAIASYKRALEIDSEHVGAYNNLGIVYQLMGEDDEAEKMYKEALRINPEEKTIHYNLAVIYKKRKQYGLALEHCNKARRLGFEVPAEFLEEIIQYK